MHRFVLTLSIVGLVACGPDRSSHVVLPPEGFALDSTGAVQRQFRADSLELIAQVGGRNERDTSLLDPYRLQAATNRVYVVEGEQRIVAYDTLGQKLWAIGRDGSGPREFRNIRDIKVTGTNEIWVHDPSNARITRINPTGKVVGYISLQHVGHSEAMVPGPGMTASLLPPYADADILTIDTSGTVIDRDTVPWPGFRELETLSRQFETANDPATGQWVMGFGFGNGWFAFRSHGGSERRFYVEPTSFPGVVKEVSDGGATVATKLMRTDMSAAGISLLADTVFVLFGGKDLPRQKVDLYSWASGKYLGSIALPEPVDNIAVSGSFLYTLSSRPVPKLAIYRRMRRAGRS